MLKLLPLYYYGPYTPFANPLVRWLNNPSPQCTSFNLVRAIPPVTSGCPVTLFMTFSTHFSFSPIPTHQLEKMDCTKWETTYLSPPGPIIVVGQWETIIYLWRQHTLLVQVPLQGTANLCTFTKPMKIHSVFLYIFIQHAQFPLGCP